MSEVRKDFEAWLADDDKEPEDGSYANPVVCVAWHAWQACAALSAARIGELERADLKEQQ